MLLKFRNNVRMLLNKNISDRKETSENRNDTGIEYALAETAEDPLNTDRTASNETALISEIPNIIN